MSEASRPTSPAAPSSQADSERLSPAPQKKPLILSVYSWCVDRPFKHPFLSASILCIALVGFIAGVAYWSYNRDARFAYQQIPYYQSGIALIGHGYLVDVINQTLSVGWQILGCGEYRLPTDLSWENIYNIPECDAFNRAVDIYFNGASEPIFSYDPAKIPLEEYRYTSSVWYPRYFSVVHEIGFSQDLVPFDTSAINVAVFVIEKATNRSVPIITFAAGGGPHNFIVSSENWSTLSNYTYDSRTGPITVEVESSIIYMEVRRSQLAKAFTVCLLLINLALTVGSVYVTVLVLTRRGQIHEGIVLFPVTVILTIPALRNLYPGSPPFGIYIDTFGFFSLMMIVALCSMVLLYFVAKSTKPVRRASRGGGGT